MLFAALAHLNPILRAAVQNEMRGNERVVWAEQPVFRLFSAGVLVPMMFGIPFTAFAVFWMLMAGGGLWILTGHGSLPDKTGWFGGCFMLFGVPFVLVGVGMLMTPIWARRAAARTVYVITTDRAIVLKPGWFGGRKVQSFEPERLAMLERVERADGSGDLIFEQYTQRRGSSTHTVRNGFLGVRRVRDAETVLRSALLADRTRPM